MKWKDLNKYEQEKWNIFAEKQQEFLKRFAWFMEERKGCFICDWKYDITLDIKPFQQTFFHIHSTHGIPEEILVNLILEYQQ